MADTARVRDFRKALAAAYRKSDSAVTAAWRARRDAYHLHAEADRLATSIKNEALRTAIAETAKKIAQDAGAAENAAADRRSAVGELLELLGGQRR